MYGFPQYHPPFPPLPAPMLIHNQCRFSYPPVDANLFAQSIRSFRLLMRQGSWLLDRLSDPGFAKKVMEAAQQGKKQQVDALIKSLDLRVPVSTRYNPSGIIFSLYSSQEQHLHEDCCTLTIPLKWGR